MKILLCAATEMEIAPTLSRLSAEGMPDVEVVVTGIGVLSTAYALAKAVALHRPGFLLQAGIAGTFDEGRNLASVVAVGSETVGDLGVSENGQFRSVFDLNLPGANVAPWEEQKLKNETPFLPECGLPVVAAVTVNEITTAADRIAYYRQTLGAAVESMEGAALHYVALQEKIPFLQLRSLSNFIGERDKTKWQLKAAIANLNRELQRILKLLHA